MGRLLALLVGRHCRWKVHIGGGHRARRDVLIAIGSILIRLQVGSLVHYAGQRTEVRPEGLRWHWACKVESRYACGGC